MKKNISSIIVILAFIGVLVSTFFFQSEYLFITRIVSLIFAIGYFIIEVKQEYFSKNKPLFVLFSAVSMLALTASILLDETFGTDEFNARVFLSLIFMLSLLVTSYRELYNKDSDAE